MGKVIAVCTSEVRGTQKKNIHTATFVKDWGIEGDAHAGNWHRQVSLLSYETIQEFNRQGGWRDRRSIRGKSCCERI